MIESVGLFRQIWYVYKLCSDKNLIDQAIGGKGLLIGKSIIRNHDYHAGYQHFRAWVTSLHRNLIILGHMSSNI